MLEKDPDARRPVHLLGDQPDRNAEESLDRHVERDAHALHGTAQHLAFGMQLHVAHLLVRHGIAGREIDGQCERVEPRARLDPAECPPSSV